MQPSSQEFDARHYGSVKVGAAALIHEQHDEMRPYLIALTRRARAEDRAAIAPAGIDDLVTKPFSVALLSDTLDGARRMLEKRHTMRKGVLDGTT